MSSTTYAIGLCIIWGTKKTTIIFGHDPLAWGNTGYDNNTGK